MKQAPLTIESEVFAQMRKDANAMLSEAFKTMGSTGCNAAAMTIKLSIDLSDGFADDKEILTHHAEREITVPKIQHKVSTVMQIKDERKGEIGGAGFELDIIDGKYVIRSLGPDQIGIFDDDQVDIDGDDDDDLEDIDSDDDELEVDPDADGD